MADLEAFVARLPKAELHVHMIGSASADTVLELARKYPDSGVPRTAEGLREFYAFRDFGHFIDVYTAVRLLIREQEDLAALLRGVTDNLAAQNVRYVEFQDWPHGLTANGIPRAAVTEVLDAAAREAQARHGLRVGYIFDFPGQRAGLTARAVLDHALEDPPESLLGLGIGGIEDERGPYRDVIRDVFTAAAAAGLHRVPHAGETVGAESVWEAIEHLHAERIGHGIRAMDDPRLVDYLAERQLPVDVSPTSNVCTRQVAALADHPLPRMIKAGLNVTLNSDDPPMFGTSLTGEYLAAARVLGLSKERLTDLAANAVRASFLDDEGKERLLADISRAALTEP